MKIELKWEDCDSIEDFETTHIDSGATFTYWWDDMRPREVKKEIKEAFLRGVEYGMLLKLDNK